MFVVGVEVTSSGLPSCVVSSYRALSMLPRIQSVGLRCVGGGGEAGHVL